MLSENKRVTNRNIIATKKINKQTISIKYELNSLKNF